MDRRSHTSSAQARTATSITVITVVGDDDERRLTVNTVPFRRCAARNSCMYCFVVDFFVVVYSSFLFFFLLRFFAFRFTITFYYLSDAFPKRSYARSVSVIHFGGLSGWRTGRVSAFLHFYSWPLCVHHSGRLLLLSICSIAENASHVKMCSMCYG